MNGYYALAVLLPFFVFVSTSDMKYSPCNDKEIYRGKQNSSVKELKTFH